MILRVISSLNKSNKLKKIVVATSKNKSDDKLVKILIRNKIFFYRGDLKNVAERMLSAAIKYKAKYFVRISADSPLINYRIVDRSVKILKKNKEVDIVTNIFPRTFPSGQSVEIIKTSILRKYLPKMNLKEKEHVTPFFYKNFEKFNIKNFKINKNLKKNNNLKQSVDYKKDIKNILKKI